MIKCWMLTTMLCASTLMKARAACDDIDTYISVPEPMTGDMEINLDGVDTIECKEFDCCDEMDQVVVEGGTLTLTSSSNVRFVNMGFVVRAGASLVFDMPKIKFGPNSEGNDVESYTQSTVEVEEGATVIFTGRVVAKEVANVYSVFNNQGSLELEKMAFFEDCSNVLRPNTGTVKFRGITTFQNNGFLPIYNEGGFIRFSKDVMFDDNSVDVGYHDVSVACSIYNLEEGKISFHGSVNVQNNDCPDGVALYNEGEMNFYGKAYFEENQGDFSGGAVSCHGGSMNFKKAAQFNNNTAYFGDGGGIAISNGGNTTFSKSVTFDGNLADRGGAFAVIISSTLTFENPSVVRFRNNEIVQDECLIGQVYADSTVIGFPGDDVCNGEY